MSVEDKIKELLEASQNANAPADNLEEKAPAGVEDLGPAVDKPETKSGPDAGKKSKKAAVPGGEANKGEQKIKPGATKVKEDEEADEDLEAIADEVLADEDLEVVAEKKTVAKVAKEEEEEDEDDDEDDDDEEEMKENEEDDKEMEEMKAKIINAMKMMDKKTLKANYSYMKSSYKKEDVDMSSDVDALTEGSDLSDEFKAKAKTVFEAAVNAKLSDKIVELEEHYQTQINEETVKVQEDLTDKVDTYLSYVVEQWTKDNELAIERGLKSEITEDFIVSLKKVFEEHYIDVPEEKYDVMAEQQDKIASLEEKLNEEIAKNAESMKSVNEAKKASKLEEMSKDLTDTQKEKLVSLAEGVTFSDVDTFEKELETLKESYFPKVAKPIEEDEIAVEEVEAVNVTGEMKDYVSAISRTIK